MKKALLKSGIFFMALMLIMATGGFSIYHHFCLCEGEVTESIFLEADCKHECAAADETLSCCAVEQNQSCCSEKSESNACENPHQDDCCNSSSSFFKIQDNFRVSIDKISFKFIAGLIQVLTGIDFISEPTAKASFSPDYNDISPPPYGTDLLHHIHQLKIAHLLV